MSAPKSVNRRARRITLPRKATSQAVELELIDTIHCFRILPIILDQIDVICSGE